MFIGLLTLSLCQCGPKTGGLCLPLRMLHVTRGDAVGLEGAEREREREEACLVFPEYQESETNGHPPLGRSGLGHHHQLTANLLPYGTIPCGFTLNFVFDCVGLRGPGSSRSC